ncbi:MAG: hypothetical protein ABIH42_09895 [Planctomycetota bacterium]
MLKKFNSHLSTRNVILVVVLFVAIVAAAYTMFPDLFTERTPSIAMVSGTEYISGEYGQIIVRANDRYGNPVDYANCNATVLYPDKTYFMLDLPLSSSSIGGNYYRQFLTPPITGIYEETINCELVSNGKTTTMTISSSFHVSLALNIIAEISKNQTLYQMELIERFLTMESDITELRNNVDNNYFNLSNKVSLLENNISYTLNRNHEDISTSIDSTNATVEKRFSDFYVDMSNLSNAMTGIFGT